MGLAAAVVAHDDPQLRNPKVADEPEVPVHPGQPGLPAHMDVVEEADGRRLPGFKPV
jgi:hypothetical protein